MTTSVLSHPDLGAVLIKREISLSAIGDRTESEPRSQSSTPLTVSTAVQHDRSMASPFSSVQSATTPTNSLISAMVDNTEYAPAVARSPSAPERSRTSDEQVLQNLAAGNANFLFITADSERQKSLRQSDDPPSGDCASSRATTMTGAHAHQARQNEAATASTTEVAAFPSDTIPRGTSLSSHDSRATLSSPSTSHPPSDDRPAQTTQNAKPTNAKPSAPGSLYPGPSATVLSSDQPSTSVTSKRPRTARSDHPERFLYAGNTFSNLDDRSFHETAGNNPYLSQLTADASRPVYKSPLEARQALKDTDKPAAVPVDYDQQIKELMDTIADFRKKYEKSKVMTTQAGIRVAGNVWDRLSNIVQYPPDYDAYTQKEQGDLGKYTADMKAWDRAVGHQVIIKKRIVYKEAIEKIQVKLDIVQAEKDFESHNMQLKRKAEESAKGDENDT
jgi:hypothetical protein